MNNNIKKFANRYFIEKEDCCAVISSQINRRYFTNFVSSNGMLIVFKDAAYFLTDFRYIQVAKSMIKDAEVVLTSAMTKEMFNIIKKHNIKFAYFEQSLSVKDSLIYKNKFTDVRCVFDGSLDKTILNMRKIKSDYEIEQIKAAQKITDDAFSYILNYIKPGISEKDIAFELEFFMRKKGAESVAFDIISVSGENSSMPHGVPSDRILKPGDFLTLDFGASYNGYKSDMTRTVGIKHLTEEQKKIYDIVLKAQTNAIKSVKSGEVCSKIDNIARQIITAAGYEKNFGHSTGHSLGLEIHEQPIFSSKCNEVLEKNMVMTVEPGIYLDGKFGVRIEDLMIIDDNLSINLTKSDKNLIIL